MQKIIYYVASSLDGFIAGLNDDISKFELVKSGNGIEKFLSDLRNFETVIMGRRTYEFGYQFGLNPGQAPYPHMQNHVFSDNFEIENHAQNVHIEKISLNRIKEIKMKSNTNIYLCGGGQFAGWLLDNGLIDQLKLKLNPILLGDGVPLFGTSNSTAVGQLIEKESFDNGLEILTYSFKQG